MLKMLIEVLLAQAFWLIGPAYAANAFPPVVHGKRPLDRNIMFRNSRLLGDGKTIEGTVAGIFFGIFYGIIQMLVQPYIPADIGLALITVPLVVGLSAGALAGDIAGSFIKRRLGIIRGDPAYLMDQLGFLLFALLFASFIISISVEVFVVLLILTPIIHWLANIIGWLVKLKKNPW